MPLNDVRTSVLRKFVYLGGALTLFFIVAGAVVKFHDQAELPFVIRNSQAEEIYRYSSTLYLEEAYVKPGDTVNKGQRLIKISSPEIASLINAYREAEHNLMNFSRSRVPSVAQRLKMLDNRIESDRSKLEQRKKELRTTDSIWQSNKKQLQNESENAANTYAANLRLYEQGNISKFDINEYESRKIKAANALESAHQNFIKSSDNLSGLFIQDSLDVLATRDELRRIELDNNYDSASVNNLFQLAKNKINSLFGDFEISDGELILKAKAPGTVAYVFDGEKEVSSGAILAKVISHNPALYAQSKCPPSLIGRIAKNNRVILKISSFPFYEWGTLAGHIGNLSLTPDENGKFSVKIAIDNFGKMNKMIQPGMDGSATVISAERTFYEYVFYNAKKAYHKAAMDEYGVGCFP